jgi:hypothetical protein
MKNLSILLILLLLTRFTFAQEIPRKYTTIDLALAGGSGFSPALSYTQMYGIGASGKFKLGYGVRLTSFFKGSTELRTAPAKFTSGNSSIVALFSDDLVANIDTFRVGRVQTNALNISINLQYQIASKLEVGFNIDAFGYTFGGKQTGTLKAINSKRRFDDGSVVSGAKPTGFNLLLVSDSDLGSLNSELYARYWVSNKIGIRAGLSFQFIEYSSDKKVAIEQDYNDRWRYKSLMPLVAVSIKI